MGVINRMASRPPFEDALFPPAIRIVANNAGFVVRQVLEDMSMNRLQMPHIEIASYRAFPKLSDAKANKVGFALFADLLSGCRPIVVAHRL